MNKRIFKIFLRKISFLKPLLENILQIECSIFSWLVSNAYKKLYLIQWFIPPTPEHFDHRIDLYYHWLASRNPLWVERGVFSSLALGVGGIRFVLR
jgi:hypothetical protein